MLPPFTNIIRLTDHGDASLFGNPWVITGRRDVCGHLILASWYDADREVYVPDRSINEGSIALFAA